MFKFVAISWVIVLICLTLQIVFRRDIKTHVNKAFIKINVIGEDTFFEAIEEQKSETTTKN